MVVVVIPSYFNGTVFITREQKTLTSMKVNNGLFIPNLFTLLQTSGDLRFQQNRDGKLLFLVAANTCSLLEMRVLHFPANKRAKLAQWGEVIFR